MDYETLVDTKNVEGSIRNWAVDNTVPAVDILTDAENWVYERLRVREMLVAATGTMSIGSDTISLPTRYRAPNHLMITGTEHADLVLKPADEVRRAWSYDGSGSRVNAKPQAYYIGASNIQMDATALKAYAYDFLHYAALAPLSSSNTTNVLTGRYSRILRTVCMGFAAEYQRHNEMRDHWLLIAEAVINEARSTDDMDMIGLQAEVIPA